LFYVEYNYVLLYHFDINLTCVYREQGRAFKFAKFWLIIV